VVDAHQKAWRASDQELLVMMDLGRCPRCGEPLYPAGYGPAGERMLGCLPCLRLFRGKGARMAPRR
jgi:hypothetical protein